ncbi:MAG: amidohydrolase family protein, partial [Woeseiaceae bacterium]
MSRQLLTNCKLFDGETVREGRAVLIEGGRIAAILPADDVRKDPDVLDLGGHLLAPGLIDLQVNGGGGVLFNDAPTIETLRTIVAAHRRYGTTACLPTLISDDAETMQMGIRAVADAMAGELPAIAGIHLEGPHLNPRYRGVHDADRIRVLDDASLAMLCSLEAGRTLVTLAPEQV